jgi:hypothetical protein
MSLILQQQQILEGNNLIAKLLGWYQQEGEEGTWFVRSEFTIDVAYSIHNNYPWRDLPFFRSWEWLHKAIDKVEEIGYNVVISRDAIQVRKKRITDFTIDLIIDEDFSPDYVGEIKREGTWSAIVSFCEWYFKNYPNGEGTNNSRKQTDS